jgi:hypothetical protein
VLRLFDFLITFGSHLFIKFWNVNNLWVLDFLKIFRMKDPLVFFFFVHPKMRQIKPKVLGKEGLTHR